MLILVALGTWYHRKLQSPSGNTVIELILRY